MGHYLPRGVQLALAICAKEKERFFNLLLLFQESGSSMVSLKRFLFKLVEKYKQGYLVNSYYFI